jgi:hypothetical protein
MAKGVAVLAVAALLAGCGAGMKSRPRTAAGQASSCIAGHGYGGLGARASAFDANNNGSTGPAEPTPGAAWYQVIGTARGCVTGYSVQDSAAPPLRASDMLALVSPYLPRDARPVARTGTCTVWESAALRRATGMPFARGTAIGQIGSLMAGSAQVQATARSTC